MSMLNPQEGALMSLIIRGKLRAAMFFSQLRVISDKAKLWMWFGFYSSEGKVQVTRYHITFLSFQHQIVSGVPFKSPFKLITIHKYYSSLS